MERTHFEARVSTYVTDAAAMEAYALEKMLAGVATASVGGIADYAANLAQAKGRHHAWATVARFVADGKSQAVVTNYMLQQVVRGADDNWSGRSNDCRRAAFDGLREVADRLLSWADDAE